MANKINELVALLNTVPAGQLTEKAVETYLNILNIEIVEKGASVDSEAAKSPVRATESPLSKASRLIAEAKADVHNNGDKYNFGSRFVLECLDDAAGHIASKNYKVAYNDLMYSSKLSANFEKYPELMAAMAALIELV